MTSVMNDEINEFYKKYGPSPLLKFIPLFKSGKNIEEIREALSKETEIPPDWIPQDMDDGLQQILGCGKYAKENING